jgi:hypothetical protein
VVDVHVLRALGHARAGGADVVGQGHGPEMVACDDPSHARAA